MKLPRRTALLLAIAALAGCQSKAPSLGERWQGELSQRGGEYFFSPCGDSRRFTLELPEAVRQSATSLAPGNEPLFVDLRASRSKPLAGVATFRLTRLYRLTYEGHGCADAAFPRLLLRAGGSEPGWVVEIHPRGLLLNRQGEEPTALPYLQERLPDGRMNFSSQANGRRLDLWIAPERCQHPASGELSEMSATLRLDGEVLHGCAYPGGALDPDAPGPR